MSDKAKKRLTYHVRVYDQRTDSMRNAVVVRRYNCWSRIGGYYPDLIDVRFEGDDRVSRGHFTDMVCCVDPKESPCNAE
jgi:hypothetical protein